MLVKRGYIIMANMEAVSKGSIQKFKRPYVVISNNMANKHSPVITAVAMTSKVWKKKHLPTHCLIKEEDISKIAEDFQARDSIALCEQIVSIDMSQIEEVVGRISNKKVMRQLDECIKNQVGLNRKNI